MSESQTLHEAPQPIQEVHLGERFGLFQNPAFDSAFPEGFYEQIIQSYRLKLPQKLNKPDMKLELSLGLCAHDQYALIPGDPRRGLQIMQDDYRLAKKPEKTATISGRSASSITVNAEFPYTFAARYGFPAEQLEAVAPFISQLSLRVFFPEAYDAPFILDEFDLDEGERCFNAMTFWPAEAPPMSQVLGTTKPDYNLYFPRDLREIQKVQAAFVLPEHLMPQNDEP